MPTSSIIDKSPTPLAGVWQIDQTHSDLRIIARHLMVAKVRGTFEDLAGTIVVADPNLRLHTGEEVAAEFERGLTRELSDLNPVRVFRERP